MALTPPCRKETFGTSGPRIKVRFFGGWDFSPDTLKQKDWVKTGYANGVPMGGDLPAPKSKAPAFIVWAVKDPDEANLDRIQIVKGWTKSGQIFEKVYYVAWSGDRKLARAPIQNVLYGGNDMTLPPVGNTVDIKNATYTNTIGAVQLQVVSDRPGFRSEPARLLLRTGAANPDAALEHLRRQDLGRSAAEQRACHHPGSRVDLADLVHADGGIARQGAARPDRRRTYAKGRDGPR